MTAKLLILLGISAISSTLFASTTQFQLIKSKLSTCPQKIFLIEQMSDHRLYINDRSFQLYETNDHYLSTKKKFYNITAHSFGIINYSRFKEQCTYYNNQLFHKAFYNSSISSKRLAEALDKLSPQEVENFISNLTPTEPTLFTTVGAIDSFDYNPPQYDLNHAINYYIPKSLTKADKAKVMVLLHGGGASTNTYDTSKAVARIYMKDFINFAEAEKMIIVAPSSSLGWSYLTRILLRNLSAMIRQELNVDANKFYLFGHSMGGMGITRDAHWVIDQFAGIMPTAAGMQVVHQKNEYFKTFFNTTYTHINGEFDHFVDFKYRILEVFKKMLILEEKLDKKSGYTALFHDGGHNYNLSMIYQQYRKDQFLKPRDLYQKSIYPLMGQMNIPVSNGWNPVILQHPLNSYLWIEATSILQAEKGFEIGFEADIEDNIVNIRIDNSDKRIKKLRVYLSKQLVNFTMPITISVNAIDKVTKKFDISSLKIIEIARHKKDQAFIFENYVDIDLI